MQASGAARPWMRYGMYDALVVEQTGPTEIEVKRIPMPS
jgi:hypothetical protein